MFRRLLAAALLVGLSVALLIFAWPQLFRLQTQAGVAQLVSLRGTAVVAAIVVVLAFFLVALAAPRARRFASSIALIFLVFVLINGAVIASRGIGDTSFETAGDNDLTVLTWNTLGDAPGAEAIAELALEAGADVVVLPETTEELSVEVARAMRAAGSPMQSLTYAYDVVSKARSTSLLVSEDLGAYTFDNSTRTTSTLPSVVATPVDGAGPTIIAVHSVAPIPGEMRNWRADLGWVRDACQGDNVIMAGDFNATIDHFSGLATADGATVGECIDSADASNNAAVGTWPTSIPALAGSPIDHVMQTPNWRVTGMRVVETHDKYGSDHRPVIVQLSPAG